MIQLSAQAQVPGPAPASSPIAGLFPLVFIFFLFYFLLIRPQQKKAKEHDQLLKGLKKGDKVAAAGGIVARILEVREGEVDLETAQNQKLTVLRGSIQSVMK
ncbi:MAG TPA: preprotein translocase subunit YajC [bacterium]|nr:preprotein translocase subunit YajC [bacterium]